MVVVELELGAVELMMVIGVVDGRAQHRSATSPPAVVLHTVPLFLKYVESWGVLLAPTVYPKRDAVPAVGSIHA